MAHGTERNSPARPWCLPCPVLDVSPLTARGSALCVCVCVWDRSLGHCEQATSVRATRGHSLSARRLVQSPCRRVRGCAGAGCWRTHTCAHDNARSVKNLATRLFSLFSTRARVQRNAARALGLSPACVPPQSSVVDDSDHRGKRRSLAPATVWWTLAHTSTHTQWRGTSRPSARPLCHTCDPILTTGRLCKGTHAHTRPACPVCAPPARLWARNA